MKNLLAVSTATTLAFIAKKDGTECPFVHLNNDLPEFRDFVAYAMMERDFQSAKELFLESQKHTESPTLFGSLVSEGVVTYSRPFKLGNQRSIRKLDPKKIFDDQASKDVHDHIQLLRDKFYAHTDKNAYEDILLCVALEPDPDGKAILDIYRSMPRTIGFDSATINNFVYVTNRALDWIDSQLNLEHKKVMDFIRTLDIDELYQVSVDPKRYDQSVQKFYLDYPFE